MKARLSLEAEGLLLMVASTVFGTVMGACAKTLGEWGLGLFVIILGSRIVLLLVTTATMVYQHVNPFRSKRKLLLLARGLLGLFVISTVFWSVQLLPLADATVLSRLFPIFVALLAPLLLHEPHSTGAWLALPVCLVGVVVMARPSFLFGGGKGSQRISSFGLVVGLSQALVQALARLSVRSLGATEPSATIIISGAVVTSTGAALLCAVVPGQLDMLPSLASCGLLGLMGCMAVGVQFTSTAALKRVRAAPAAAVNYLSVVWALVVDYLMFGNRPTLLSLLGVALICGSTLVLMLWEARRRCKTSKYSNNLDNDLGGEEGGKDSEEEEEGGPGAGQDLEEELEGDVEVQRLLQPKAQAPQRQVQRQAGHGEVQQGQIALEQELAERGLARGYHQIAHQGAATGAGGAAAAGAGPGVGGAAGVAEPGAAARGSSSNSDSSPAHLRQRHEEGVGLPEVRDHHEGVALPGAAAVPGVTLPGVSGASLAGAALPGGEIQEVQGQGAEDREQRPLLSGS